MDVYVTEHEQLDALKKWWKENGKSALAGVAIGLSILFVIWAWRDHTRSQAEAAATEYQQLIGEVEKGDVAAGLTRGTRIRSQYSDTPYAVFASFAMAKLELSKGNTKEEQSHLQWALDHAGNDGLQHIARLRLARVLIDAGQAQQALKLIDSVQPGSFAAGYAELKGDSYLKMGQRDAALGAYQAALKALDEADAEQRAAVQMKLDDLGAKPAEQG